MNKTSMTIITGLLFVGYAGGLYAADVDGGLPQTERTQNINANTAEAPVTPAAEPASSMAEENSPATAAQSSPTTAAAADDSTEQTGFSRGSVVRSTFTSSIDNREPVDTFEKYQDDSGRVYFFTELRDMSGQTAKHRWEHKGEVVAEVEFNVRGPRWRVWSSKQFQPNLAGEWKVSVINGANEVISEKTLQLVRLEMPASETPAQNMEAEKTAPAPASNPASVESPSTPPTVE